MFFKCEFFLEIAGNQINSYVILNLSKAQWIWADVTDKYFLCSCWRPSARYLPNLALLIFQFYCRWGIQMGGLVSRTVRKLGGRRTERKCLGVWLCAYVHVQWYRGWYLGRLLLWLLQSICLQNTKRYRVIMKITASAALSNRGFQVVDLVGSHPTPLPMDTNPYNFIQRRIQDFPEEGHLKRRGATCYLAKFS